MSGAANTGARRSRRWALIASTPLGFLLSALWIWQGSQAAYTATTVNPGNGFAAGTVRLSDDDSGAALFSVSGLQPGDTGQRCVTVTYDGSLDAQVRLFVAPGGLTGTGLGNYLNLNVEEGTGGGGGSCTGFTPSVTAYSGTLAALAAGSTDSATGIGSFAPTGAGQSSTYRFTYTLNNNNAAQGLNCQVTFTWEATSV